MLHTCIIVSAVRIENAFSRVYLGSIIRCCVALFIHSRIQANCLEADKKKARTVIASPIFH